jgi:hypothetical protein
VASIQVEANLWAKQAAEKLDLLWQMVGSIDFASAEMSY